MSGDRATLFNTVSDAICELWSPTSVESTQTTEQALMLGIDYRVNVCIGYRVMETDGVFDKAEGSGVGCKQDNRIPTTGVIA
jgi:hypothetical protein